MYKKYRHINNLASFQRFEYIIIGIHKTRKCMPDYTKRCSNNSVPVSIETFLIINAKDRTYIQETFIGYQEPRV